tara:strand:+ start:15 stop:785 length:771 start_codon:yes stop_codon:yes gene_type:complete
MKIIVLAAGEGSRLRPYTNNKPKCMVRIFGKSILGYQLEIFKNFGIDDITVIGGYRYTSIKYPNINIIENSKYKETNMVYSLMCARKLFDGENDIIITYGDIIYEERIFESILNSHFDFSLTIDNNWKKLWKLRMSDPLEDAETLKILDGKIVEIGKKPKNYQEIEGQYMGIIKIRSSKQKKLIEFWDSMDKNILYDRKNIDNIFFTTFIQCLIDHSWEIHSIPVSNGWLEIDTNKDLDIYEKLFSSGKLNKIFTK